MNNSIHGILFTRYMISSSISAIRLEISIIYNDTFNNAIIINIIVR